MSDQPFVGRVYLEIGQGGSPEDYERMCEMMSVSGLGEVNALVDVTTFCSGGTREYIGGLADGTEFTIGANFIVNSDTRRQLIAAVKNKSTISLRMVVDDDNDDVTDLAFYFRAAALGWTFNPSIDDKNGIDFTLKISGSVDIQEPSPA